MASTVFSWGDNSNGQLGVGEDVEWTREPLTVDLEGVREIASGSGHVLALDDSGAVWAWGRNSFGQLGIGDADMRARPERVLGLTDIRTVDGGGGHSIALANDGTVWAWGAGFFGALADDTPFMRPVPERIEGLERIVAIAAGGAHNAALDEDGYVYTWGRDDHGQLADGPDSEREGREVREFQGNSFACRPVPARVEGVEGVVSIATGGGHILTVLDDGSMIAWGFNDMGQVGDGTTTDQFSPIKVGLPSRAATADAGYHHSVVLLEDGRLLAWGLNDGGQLGDGTTNHRHLPQPVPGVSGVKAITANGGGNDINPGGGGHNLALLEDGTVLGWGWNDRGQLGDGTTENRATPVRVAGLEGVRGVAVGGDVPAPREQPTAGTSWALR